MWKNSVCAFLRDDEGEDLIEYGLLAAFVATVAVTVLSSPVLRSGVSDALSRAVSTLVNKIW